MTVIKKKTTGWSQGLFVFIVFQTLVPHKSFSWDWVEVEQNYITNSPDAGNRIPSYRDRRQSWVIALDLAYSWFQPNQYQPNFRNESFKEIYGSAEMPMLETTLYLKRNIAYGSVSLGIGVGYYQNESSPQDALSLELIPARVQCRWDFDALIREPYIVPYAFAGGYVVFFREKQSQAVFGGSTQMAPYFGGGAAFSIDWIEPDAKVAAYADDGLENLFLYIEGRLLAHSSSERDPQFTSNLGLAAGLRLEF